MLRFKRSTTAAGPDSPAHRSYANCIKDLPIWEVDITSGISLPKIVWTQISAKHARNSSPGHLSYRASKKEVLGCFSLPTK